MYCIKNLQLEPITETDIDNIIIDSKILKLKDISIKYNLTLKDIKLIINNKADQVIKKYEIYNKETLDFKDLEFSLKFR